MRKIIKLNKNFLNLIGYNESHNKDDIIKTAIENYKKTIKPCEKLNYCPYGYLVEHFPLLPTTKNEAQKWYNHVTNFIKKGEYKRDHLKKMQERINNFNIEEHPENIPKNIKNMKCPHFGHLCPVYFCKEELE